MPLRQGDDLSSASSTLSSLKLSSEGSFISSGTTESSESGKSLGRGATRYLDFSIYISIICILIN